MVLAEGLHLLGEGFPIRPGAAVGEGPVGDEDGPENSGQDVGEAEGVLGIEAGAEGSKNAVGGGIGDIARRGVEPVERIEQIDFENPRWRAGRSWGGSWAGLSAR